MADDAQLLQALQAAHEAGNEEHAAEIAKQLVAQPISPVRGPLATPVKKVAIDPSAGGGTLSVGPFDTGIQTPQGVNRFLAGAGQSMMDTYRGLKQLTGFQTPQETDEQRRLDLPLDRTGAGLLGNVTGGVAQFALPGMGAGAVGAKIAAKLGTSPGALQAAKAIYRIAAPATAGAAIGAEAPVGTNETRLGNTGRGALAGEAGHILGTGIGTMLRTGEDALSRGARTAADIARKYSIPLQMSQTAGKFTQLLQSALDKFPGSGAEGRANTQKRAFGKAVGDVSGVDAQSAPIDMESWQQGRKAVGQAIGNMAEQHTAFVTPAEVAGVNNILRQVNSKATDQNAKIVNNWVNDLFGPNSKAVPIQNPLPGGPVMQIPGAAWRQQHTELADHLARLGDNDGDLAHYLGGLKSQYLDAMEHGMPPDEFEAFQGLRHQYSNAMAIKPLVAKTPLGEDLNPTLLQNRLLTDEKMYKLNGAPTDIGELAQLGQKIKNTTPDSGTAQRLAIYGGLTGVAGAGANELFGGNEEHQHQTSGAIGLGSVGLPLATLLAGAAGSRAMGSRLAARYAQGRLPATLAAPVEGMTETLPAATSAAASDTQQPPADQPMADGGQPKKSTFWDLVKQAYKPETPDAVSP